MNATRVCAVNKRSIRTLRSSIASNIADLETKSVADEAHFNQSRPTNTTADHFRSHSTAALARLARARKSCTLAKPYNALIAS